jgi:hypothetical protein
MECQIMYGTPTWEQVSTRVLTPTANPNTYVEKQVNVQPKVLPLGGALRRTFNFQLCNAI